MGTQPSTENVKNAIMEASHWANTMSSATQNPVQQRKTRVSELSVIDLNDPLPTKRVHSTLDCNLETKSRDDTSQETRTLQRQVQETAGRDLRQEKGGYSNIGKKLRRSRNDEKANPRWS